MFVERQFIKIILLLFFSQLALAGENINSESKLSVNIELLSTESLKLDSKTFNVSVISKTDTDSLRIMVQPQGRMKMIEGQMMWRGTALAGKPVKFDFTIDAKSLQAQGVMVTAVVAGKNGKQQAARDVYRFSGHKVTGKEMQKANNK